MLDDVIVGPLLREFVSLVTARPLHVVVLAPSLAAVEMRARERADYGYGAWTPAALDAVLREETPRIGLWVDSSEQTAEETADFVLRHLDEAVIGAR